MSLAAAFGLGLILGGMLTFRAGMRYDRARQASLIAAEYVGSARRLWGGAGSAIALLALVVAGGLALMFFGS